MPSKKLFKELSRSQKYRRLRALLKKSRIVKQLPAVIFNSANTFDTSRKISKNDLQKEPDDGSLVHYDTYNFDYNSDNSSDKGECLQLWKRSSSIR